MTTPNVNMPFTWEVIGIESGQYEPGPNSTPVLGKRVTFKLGGGTTDSVFIPDSQWGTEVAQQIIARRAKITYEISQMTSSASGS